jgi:hypothetical protein
VGIISESDDPNAMDIGEEDRSIGTLTGVERSDPTTSVPSFQGPLSGHLCQFPVDPDNPQSEVFHKLRKTVNPVGDNTIRRVIRENLRGFGCSVGIETYVLQDPAEYRGHFIQWDALRRHVNTVTETIGLQ